MATTEQIPQVASFPEPQAAGKSYNESRATIKVTEKSKDDKGAEITNESFLVLENDKAQARLEKLKAEGVDAEIVKVQEFTYHEAEKIEDLELLVPDPEARLNIFNRGYVLRQQQEIRGFMTDENQAAVEGVYDLLKDASSRTERAKASPAEKALKAVAKAVTDMSPTEAQAYLAKLMAQFSGQAEEQPA